MRRHAYGPYPILLIDRQAVVVCIRVTRRGVIFGDLLGCGVQLADFALALHLGKPDVALGVRTNRVRRTPRRRFVVSDLAGFRIQFANHAFVDFGRVHMPVLGLGDSMRADFPMAKIRVRKHVGPKAPGIIQPLGVHALNRVHPHFGHIDRRGKLAGPDIVAGNIFVCFSKQRRR